MGKLYELYLSKAVTEKLIAVLDTMKSRQRMPLTSGQLQANGS